MTTLLLVFAYGMAAAAAHYRLYHPTPARRRHRATRGRFNQHGPLVTPGRHRTPEMFR